MKKKRYDHYCKVCSVGLGDENLWELCNPCSVPYLQGVEDGKEEIKRLILFNITKDND